MFARLAKRFFGTRNERILAGLQGYVDQINALEPQIAPLSDDELKAKTQEFQTRLKEGAKLDDLMCEAFAVVREATKRVLGQRHFDVQILGGITLHQGNIAEMKTGEGKTQVAVLAAYLNALEGKGVHVVTVNEYLAKRDSEWMGTVYGFLGLSTGVIYNSMDEDERRAAYACDITYGTNNEFGFDYLRDNMKFERGEMVQRPFNFAIVDEVDSILIDEARTPLIISGVVQGSVDLYQNLDKIIPNLVEADYELDEKMKTVNLTDMGVEHVEELLREAGLLEEGSSLYDAQNITLVHHTNQALRAHKLFTRDKDYIVKDNRVIIIDEFTGRMMEGRRYGEGLHQAIEAKEEVEIQRENQTLASITFQNYFRMYPKLSGMTGTALTEQAEFAEIYNLDVLAIPTNLPIARADYEDEIYRTAQEKYEAIVHLIKDCQSRKQPVLVGTTSIEKSEVLSTVLKKQKIKHQVLNARHHEQEAVIVAQAGRPGAVTIATNMAGRGTDIKLGGNLEMRLAQEIPANADELTAKKLEKEIRAEIEAAKQEVLEAGGLYVLGTERHESRRIDNQLRGRSGRQGDPGASKFFISLEDDLMRIFGSERMDSFLQKMGMEYGHVIRHPWISKALERAQQKVEGQHFEVRKNLLKFDNVMNDQRKVIYEQRLEIMESEDMSEMVSDMRHDQVDRIIAFFIPEKSYPEQWDTENLEKEVSRIFGLDLDIQGWAKEEGIAEQEMRERLMEATDEKMRLKEEEYGADVMRTAEKFIILQLLDQAWKEHLLALDHLRQGIGLRAYGQKDPLNEYKYEAFALFDNMLEQFRENVVLTMSHVSIKTPDSEALAAKQRALMGADMALQEGRGEGFLSGDEAEMAEGPRAGSLDAPNLQQRRTREASNKIDPQDPSTWGRVKRNDPCPCGSGEKYKHCHGKLLD